MLQGPPDQVPAFVGFIKREISRRWGRHPSVDWSGTMWHRSLITALPTEASQVNCLKYILSQGTKEGLVARPQDWPGVHCARALLTGHAIRGRWFNATGYSRQVDSESRRLRPSPVKRRDYYVDHTVRLAPIPPWRLLSEATRREKTHELVREIELESAVARGDQAVLGAKQVKRISMARRTPMPSQPWLQRRRRLVCWSSPHAPETVEYLARYWAFQDAFRAASQQARHATQLPSLPFPIGSYVPGRINLPPPPSRTLNS